MATIRRPAIGRRDEARTAAPENKVPGRIEGKQAMVTRLTGAVLRAVMIMLLVFTPYLLVPGTTAETTQIVVLMAIIGAIFTLAEYASAAPSVIEFRDAPPFNRLRFAALCVTVVVLALIERGQADPNTMTRMLEAIGTLIGNIIDFPYSPVRLVVLMMPAGADPALVHDLRNAAGISYLTSLVMLTVFVIGIRLRHWPVRDGAFNIWVNLPTFDPTAGGDVVERLNRDAQFNLILGFLLPFIIPAFIKLTSDLIDPISFTDSYTLIWTMTAWAFLPASLLMRGIALYRVSQMIAAQRRRAHGGGDRLQPV